MAEVDVAGDHVLRSLTTTGYLKIPVGFTEKYGGYNLKHDPDALPPPTVRMTDGHEYVTISYTWRKQDLKKTEDYIPPPRKPRSPNKKKTKKD